jgi:hypothetical protein
LLEIIAGSKKIMPKALFLSFLFLIVASYVSAQEIQESSLLQILSLMNEKESRIAGERESLPHREHLYIIF